MIKQLIDRTVIIEALQSVTKQEVLAEILAAVAAADQIPEKNVTALTKRLIEREGIGSTGIGSGIAVPHIKGKEISTVCLALACSAQGVEFQAIDGQPVHTIFLILAPLDAQQDHLAVLRWISTLARNPDFRRFVRSARDVGGIRELLIEMSGSP